MSEKRFRFLVRCLWFDYVRDQAARKKFDKLSYWVYIYIDG